jgi:molybdenum cofactor cytidylyltransferase
MGRAKALLEYQGQTFLGRLVSVFQHYCDPVILVLPPAGLACPEGVLCTVNPAPERGMLTSLQCGLRAVPDAAEYVFFTPVDLPAIQPSTVAGLASGIAAISIPLYNGRRGHPVLIARGLIPEFLALPSSAQARDAVERHANEIRYIDVDDPGILMDIDDPADYERLTGGAA